MQFIKIFDRKNRKWLADISSQDGQWRIHGADGELNKKLSGLIQKITAFAPRHIGAFKEGETIVEVAENKEIEPREENLPFLQRALSGWFPLYRFIIFETDDVEKEMAAAKKSVADAKYLTPEQKEKILKMFEELSENEIPLLLDDIQALERLSKLI